MEFTGERYIPELESPDISYEHWHRYLFASQFVKGKVVLDIACGEGYGSYFLSKTAEKVIGVDVSQETIKYASSKYIKDNLGFNTGPASKIPIDNVKFDVIVSFETIEHITEADQAAFLAEVKRLLKPNGIFVVSTPNKFIYSDLHHYKNEFHVKEFYIPEFRELLNTKFLNIDLLGQRIEIGSYITGLDDKERSLTEYRLNFTETGFRPTDDPRDIRYVVAVCSDKPLGKVNSSIALDLSMKMLNLGEKRIGDLQNQLAEKEQTMQALTAQVAEKNQFVQALTAQDGEREQTMQALMAQVAEKNQFAQALTTQLNLVKSELDQTKTEILKYALSKSWRFTRPLRKIEKFFKEEKNA